MQELLLHSYAKLDGQLGSGGQVSPFPAEASNAFVFRSRGFGIFWKLGEFLSVIAVLECGWNGGIIDQDGSFGNRDDCGDISQSLVSIVLIDGGIPYHIARVCSLSWRVARLPISAYDDLIDRKMNAQRFAGSMQQNGGDG